MAKKADDFDTPDQAKKFRITVLDEAGRTVRTYPAATLVRAENGQIEVVSQGGKTVIVSGTWGAEEE